MGGRKRPAAKHKVFSATVEDEDVNMAKPSSLAYDYCHVIRSVRSVYRERFTITTKPDIQRINSSFQIQ